EKIVYNLRGMRLFAAAFDAIEYAGEGMFVITRNDRKGVLDRDGKTVVSPQFDFIGSAKDGVISLLKNKRFGAYSIGLNKLIRPQYDRNIQPYNTTAVITFKD